MVCGTCFADPDMFVVFKDCVGVFGGETRLVMSKTICAPDTSSLKTSSGAIEGVLDYGVLWRPGYMMWAGQMGREDTR